MNQSLNHTTQLHEQELKKQNEKISELEMLLTKAKENLSEKKPKTGPHDELSVMISNSEIIINQLKNEIFEKDETIRSLKYQIGTKEEHVSHVVKEGIKLENINGDEKMQLALNNLIEENKHLEKEMMNLKSDLNNMNQQQLFLLKKEKNF